MDFRWGLWRTDRLLYLSVGSKKTGMFELSHSSNTKLTVSCGRLASMTRRGDFLIVEMCLITC